MPLPREEYTYVQYFCSLKVKSEKGLHLDSYVRMYHRKNWGHVTTAAAAVYIDAEGKTESMQLLMTCGNEV